MKVIKSYNTRPGFLRLFFSLAILAGSWGLSASAYYNFNTIEFHNGIPSGVTCIFTEDRGFAWVGTPEGLIRYDGNEVRRYTSWEGDENSLPDNDVIQIVQDVNGDIWIVTSRGIARYRAESDDFYVPLFNSEMVMAHCAYPAEDGLYLGAQNVLHWYDYASDQISVLQKFRTDSPFYYIDELFPWKEGKMLCFNRWQGVLELDLKSGETSRPLPCSRENFGMYIGADKRIWLAPYNRGIECYDFDGSLMASYNTGNSALSNDIVLCMTESDGKIWIGTDGGGVNVLDPETGEISAFMHVPGEANSLPDNSIRSLHIDASGNIWTGRVKGGLCVIHKTDIQHFTDCPPGATNGLSEKNINYLYQEPHSSTVWIGTNGEGVNKFNPDNGEFTHYPSTQRMKVISITSYSPTELLLSTFSGGLFIFDVNSGNVTRLSVRNSNLNYQMLYSGRSVNLLSEAGGTILMLTDSVYRYSLGSRKVGSIAVKDKYRGNTQAIGTRDGISYFQDLQAIYSLSPTSLEAETIFAFGADTLINSVSIGPEGVFYIASDKGVGCYDPRTRHYRHIKTSLFDGAKSVVCDNSGRLWLGTDHALFACFQEEEAFVLFGESDGVMPIEYRPKARLVTEDGDIYLGGVNGLLKIDKFLRIDESEDFDIVLTDAELDSERLNSLMDDKKAVKVPYGGKMLKIRVLAKEDDMFRKRLYKFRVNGPHRDEVIQTYEPVTELRSIVPGTYQIDVTCNTKDGRWLPWSKVMKFTMRPPWYMTRGFRIACVLLVLLILGTALYTVLRVRQNRLEQEYKEKERQNSEEKIRFLINICHELRTPLMLIMTPLSKMLSKAREGAQTEGEKKDTRYLRLIYKQAQRMKELIDTVLYVRKMEVQGSTIFMEPHNINEWIIKAMDDFSLEAEFRNIKMKFEPGEGVGTVYFDEKQCLIVLNNLLVNSLKHSPDGSEITVRTGVVEKTGAPSTGGEAGGMVRVSVIDNGPGLGNEDMEHLFTRFYQGRGESSGSGIGLSASKILIEQHGGRIGAMNNDGAGATGGETAGNGATFYFDLPSEGSLSKIICPPGSYLNDIISEQNAAEKEYEGAVEGAQAKSGALIKDTVETTTDEGTNEFSCDISKVNMLIVDDDKEFTDLLGAILSEKVNILYSAHDGVEALSIIGDKSIDVVISDLKMPRMDGNALCREMKTRIDISHIPIILLTEYDDEKSRMLGYKNGADGYLTKPFDPEMLLTVVGNILHNRDIVRKKYQQQTGEESPKPVDMTFSSADEMFITRLNEIIEGNIDRPEIRIPFICHEIGMSRTVLYNKLRAITGMNIKDYMNKIRMEKAIELVRGTHISFSEISIMVGFSSSRYFSTAFKQYTGQTPSDYRALSQQS